MTTSRLLDDLNEAQIEAVTHSGGPLLIVAGAGSGKTRVITRRIAWLAEQGTPPEQVLALTFSAKAAQEMRARAEELIQDPYEELRCSTFHAFCSRLLSEEGLGAGLDPFLRPVAQAERVALLIDRADDLTLRHHELHGSPARALGELVDRIDRLKDEMITATDYEQWAASLVESGDEAFRERAEKELEFARFYADHDRMLQEAGALDFGELILSVIRMLEHRAETHRRVSGRFRHVLVDEFQDTNFAQAHLLRLLVREHRNVCVVGDDDQSIYRFRGASRKNISDFQEHFPDAALVRLETNYRSGQTILDAAHAVVARNEDRVPKKLEAFRSKDAEGRDPISFWRCENERAQAQAVSAEVESLIADGADPGEVAVLVHSVRSEGHLIAAALEERGIPFALVGAAALFERSEIRTLLAWLRLLADPGDAQAVVRAVMRSPVELSSVDLARATQIARRRKADMISALEATLEVADVPAESRERIKGFLHLYRSASRAFDDMSPDRFVGRLIERLGMREQQLLTADRGSLERLANISKFAALASTWAQRNPAGTPREFARHVVAAADAGLREDEADVPGSDQVVRVMTMHAAKGLEFDHVYVLGLHSNRMPGSRRSGPEPIPDPLLKESLPQDTRDAHVAEMRRLLHVAMTRARERLVLAWPEHTSGSGTQVQQKPSPFCEEARAAVGADEQRRGEELLGLDEDLRGAFRTMRDDVLHSVAQVGDRLGEMRLDAHLDAVRAIARYIELLKLAALIKRHPKQELEAALKDINHLLLQIATPEQRKILGDSNLDRLLLESEHKKLLRRDLVAERAQPSLESFIPRRGDGLTLSATDIVVYRSCPLRYKFARVYAIRTEATLQQRFGILMHQVLERFHSQLTSEEAGDGSASTRGSNPGRLLALFENAWRRSGFGDSNEERQLHEKAVAALARYQEVFASQEATPVSFERNFSFRIGPHLLRGRVDRVDKLPGGSFELIDYKTGRARKPSQLKDDIQLSLYQIGARESWKLEATKQSYYYVLDDEKVAVEPDDEDINRIEETVTTVAEGILSQRFAPQPSWAACNICDFGLICPAAEK